MRREGAAASAEAKKISELFPRREPIPASLKPYFFAGSKPVSLLADYDVIGFDIDNCLVKFNKEKYTICAVKAILAELHRQFPAYYPAEVLDFDYSKNLDVFLNNAVWDVEHGTILKLGEGKVITHAIRGFEHLRPREMEYNYGTPPRFNDLKWPKVVRQIEESAGAHWILSGVDALKVPVIC